MGIIKNLKTGENIFLKSHHVFGRNREKADTALKNKDISQIHASVRWNGWEWLLTDFSRNGTWIDGTRLISGENTRLKEGNIIRFSSIGGSEWTLIDEKPPSNVLVPLRGNGQIIMLDRFHALPNEAEPDISIYISQTGEWVYENENGVHPLKNGDIINHSQGVWQFFAAEPVDMTISKKIAKDIRFFFHVSSDEEHVFLKIQIDRNIIDLGERAHHYMLLTLARQRLKDAEDGADQETQGWIETDRMADMLGLEPCHLNIQIYRSRKQINDALSELQNPPQVIDRRFGGLRFGYPDFQIMRGSTVEGALYREKSDESQ
ncbi:MAG: FHA domain-containing protein [Proteobacteria bacterium]|nr:FHA domain-containing protein [Pseudomonadota bacterium]